MDLMEIKKELRFYLNVKDLKQSILLANQLGLKTNTICKKSNVSMINYTRYLQGMNTLSDASKQKLLTTIERILY